MIDSMARKNAAGPRPPLAVFCDFDGTLAVKDVGATIAQRYAAERRAALWKRLVGGELTPWAYNLELLDGLSLPEGELDDFLESVDLDPGARALLAWCQGEGVPFRILSDGFDRNLDRLQAITGVGFAYDANGLCYRDGAWSIRPGHPNEACGCGTGTCKRGRIEAYQRDHPGVATVHIGNGRVSDLCGAESADLVFAKDSLAAALEERGAKFHAFRTLNDVVTELERWLAEQRQG